MVTVYSQNGKSRKEIDLSQWKNYVLDDKIVLIEQNNLDVFYMTTQLWETWRQVLENYMATEDAIMVDRIDGKRVVSCNCIKNKREEIRQQIKALYEPQQTEQTEQASQFLILENEIKKLRKEKKDLTNKLNRAIIIIERLKGKLQKQKEKEEHFKQSHSKSRTRKGKLDEFIPQILEMRAAGYSLQKIANFYGVSKSTVSAAIKKAHP